MGFWDDAEVIACYSRHQAIADGALVQVSGPGYEGDDWIPAMAREAGLRQPVALTVGAWSACIGEPGEPLPAGQDIKGRLWDVLTLAVWAIRRNRATDRATFEVSVFDGERHHAVALWIHCGPGDDAEPVLTIMREGED